MPEISPCEIVATLRGVNGRHFQISDLPAYAEKVTSRGKALVTRDGPDLVSYVLYYDDGPEAFVTMVWTHPEKQRRGHALKLLRQLTLECPKPIALEVHPDNPARSIYTALGFQPAGNGSRMRLGRRVAIMQPYVYPYLGYFHLIHSADAFVFYDDVHFIKKGRIHRNSILVNGAPHVFTVPIVDASQNRLIMDTELHGFKSWREHFFSQIRHSYRRAPHFDQVYDVIRAALDQPHRTIADVAIASATGVTDYLGHQSRYLRSSECSPETRGQEKADRLIEIVKSLAGTRYVNSIGGTRLYDKSHFADRGVILSFVKSEAATYRQFTGTFRPNLSIVDVLMFNEPAMVRQMLSRYELV